jgi:hypothetical protein
MKKRDIHIPLKYTARMDIIPERARIREPYNW